MEVLMEEVTKSTDLSTARLKEAYIKPTLSQIRLVVEEAVLAVCKDGVFTTCRPTMGCSWQPTS
jgi:hypothetical protein